MSWIRQTCLAMTLDPLHVGTGAYRLGRVDNAIVREPGTNLPKIPGTTLAGAARSYAAMRYEKTCCAGQGQPGAGREGHCGKRTCPICYTFGHTVGQGSYVGAASLFDAQILLFPVTTMTGPAWVATEKALTDLGFTVTAQPGSPSTEAAPATTARSAIGLNVARREDGTGVLNLGWLLLDVTAERPTIQAPSEWRNTELGEVLPRIVLVEQELLPQIVNSNLEVRTSVSIDPRTGAAQPGALFTYEALPRGTFLVFDVVEDNYSQGVPWPVTHKVRREEREVNGRTEVIYHENNGEPLGDTWRHPCDVARAGLELARTLGIGGMGTRGFGRLALVGSPKEEVIGAVPASVAGGTQAGVPATSASESETESGGAG